MAEWSKAPDSSDSLPVNAGISGHSGPRMWAWVRIPLLTIVFSLKCFLDLNYTVIFDFTLRRCKLKRRKDVFYDSNLSPIATLSHRDILNR